VQSEPAVVVLVAVVVEELLAERAGCLDVVEVVGEGGAVLERLERRLRVRVVVRYVRPGVATGHVQVDEQLRDGLAGHRGTPVGVHRVWLAVGSDDVVDELGGQFGGLALFDPASRPHSG
jgi:hypothetical protein